MSSSQPTKGKALFSRLKPFIERLHQSFVRNGSRAHLCAVAGTECGKDGQFDFSKWRKLDSRKLGIKRSLISPSSWIVLKTLHSAGFEAYLVGGCVRDFLLSKVPKDFDVITTARLNQVKKKFQHAIIVGTRYPVCRVTVKGSVVEVSSFETVNELSRSKQVSLSKIPTGCDLKDFTRWNNCMHRDFTINSLFYDPFANTVFDYTNAIVDLRSLKLRTVIPAHLSFKVDVARILRGLRLAARLNLSFLKETEAAIYHFSSSVAGLNKCRICLEMNYMLSYGAAEPSLLLLKRFRLLENLLPFNAAYLSERADSGLDLHSSMLMKLFSNMDQLITCDRPCHDCLWVALLAFHIALFNNPQKAMVVLTFAFQYYHGTWEGSIKFARQHAPSATIYVPEILDDFESLSDSEVAERVIKFSTQVEDSVNVLINKDCLFKSLARFPEFSCSYFVLVSKKIGRRVQKVFNSLKKSIPSLADEKGLDKDYSLLKPGDTHSTRYMLGKIIINTLVSGASEIASKVEKDRVQITDPALDLEVLKQNQLTAIQLRAINSACSVNKTQSISRSNCKLSPDSAVRLSGDSFAADINMQLEAVKCESFEFSNHNSSLNKIARDKHAKAMAPRTAGTLLSRLFK